VCSAHTIRTNFRGDALFVATTRWAPRLAWIPVTTAGTASDPAAMIAQFGRHLLAVGLDDLTDRLVAMIQSTVAGYSAGGPVPPGELRASCRRNLCRQLQALVGDLPPGGDPDDVAAETGRRRAAQGLPLESLLASYRLGGRILWEGLAREAREGSTPVDMDRLLDAATWVWEVIDRHSAVVSEAYRDEESRLRRRDIRRQQVLLDALVDGHGADPAVAADAARVLDMPLLGPRVVVVGAFESPGPEPLRVPEEALSVRGLVSAWRVRAGREIGVVALGSHPIGEVLATLRGCCAGRVAVSPVVQGFPEVGAAHRMAEAALQTLPAAHVGVVTLRERFPEALLAGSPEIARLLVDDVLGGMLRLPDRERAPLLATLAAVLAAGGSPTHAAQALFCHRNTVIKRVARIQALTGRSLSRAEDRLVLTLAQRALG